MLVHGVSVARALDIRRVLVVPAMTSLFTYRWSLACMHFTFTHGQEVSDT